MEWRPRNSTKAEITEGMNLKAKYRIQEPAELTSCSTCHR
jgi:cytochrome c553